MTFEPLILPREMREDLGRSLLAEFGAARVYLRGDELVHNCVLPWHDDRSPSAGLNIESMTFKCFSCGGGGGLLWLIATCRGEPWAKAKDWVLSSTGLDGEDTEMLLRFIDLLSVEEAPERKPIPAYSPRVLEPWAFIHPWLTEPPEEGGRGIPEQNIIDAEVGYAEAYPMDREGTVSERIVVPHFWRGKLVGWQSRRLVNDGTPKWISTEEFPRDKTIFRPPSGSTAVVVESPMSVLRHMHHLPICATFGANVTDEQIRHLAGYSRVILFPDPDPAGWRSMLGVSDSPGMIQRLEPYADVDVVQTDWAVDAGDMDEDTVTELVDSAVPAMFWEPPERLRCWVCKKVHSGDC